MLETPRLILRQWREEDLPAFVELSADTEVMKYFPSVLAEAQSLQFVKDVQTIIAEKGWGLWAVEEKSSGEFIGFVGLHEPEHALPFSPCVEIGWRLARAYWGKGYATEAANRALAFAFEQLKLSEVVSFTTVTNQASRSVMERLGMLNTKKNFAHPALPDGHFLREHVLYKISKQYWLQSHS